MTPIIGIDVGGSSVKGAPVDLTTGELLAPALRIPTPEPSTPDAVATVVAEIIRAFDGETGNTPVGLAVPAPVQDGTIPCIANLHTSWTGLLADLFFTRTLGRPVTLVNDADAAGLAEARLGAARDSSGLVLVTTLGTGIGSAVIYRGMLIPNTELGHLELAGHDAEKRAAASIKVAEGLSYEQWATERLQPYYRHVEMLLAPDLLVICGTVARDWDEFGPLLRRLSRSHTLISTHAGFSDALDHRRVADGRKPRREATTCDPTTLPAGRSPRHLGTDPARRRGRGPTHRTQDKGMPATTVRRALEDMRKRMPPARASLRQVVDVIASSPVAIDGSSEDT
ncbi:polyphosphate--glucose phosphotransferase [Microbacterium sp.]|uniref:polyphosphate--glucose phosphotransferase n=1 Tax=Microbacterium sp. TaxID=51671 RepID=UPI003C71222D